MNEEERIMSELKCGFCGQAELVCRRTETSYDNNTVCIYVCPICKHEFRYISEE